jgi:hypothetical protein
MNIHEYEGSLKYKVAVMEAALAGAPVESTLPGESSWHRDPLPQWLWGQRLYRIASVPQKTVREWLEELPEGYRERALSQLSVDEKSCPRSLAFALVEAFPWDESPEGALFWSAVFTSYVDFQSPLPPLPPVASSP